MSPRDTTFNLSRVQSTLGVKNPINPRFRAESFSPVAIVADFSNTFAPESIEARGVYMGTIDSQAPHNSCDLILQSLSAGGVVIEHLVLVVLAGAPSLYFDIVAARPWVPTGNFTAMGIGGLPVASALSWNHNQALGAPDINLTAATIVFPTDRTFLPPGACMRFGSKEVPAAVHQIHFEIMWREIPEQLGAP